MSAVVVLVAVVLGRVCLHESLPASAWSGSYASAQPAERVALNGAYDRQLDGR